MYEWVLIYLHFKVKNIKIQSNNKSQQHEGENTDGYGCFKR